MDNQKLVEEFLARGGQIEEVEESVRAMTPKELRAKARGEDYTDERMREAENEVHVRRPYYR